MEATDKEEIIKRLYPEVYRFALVQLKDRQTAEDVAQETFYRFLKTESTFESEELVKTWLFSVAANLCKSYWRSSWFRRVFSRTGQKNEGSSNEWAPDEESAGTEEAAETANPTDCSAEDRLLLREALSALPKKYREVVVLYYYNELTTAEIAKVLLIRQSVVTTRLSRGRERLKNYLEEKDYER